MILEYSSDEVSESQHDQLISPEYPTAEDIAKIKKMKKSVKLTIPCHPTVEGLTKLFITWYKDHGMTMSLRKALEANRWTEQMIHKFKWVYIRKYKILQDYAMRYPDEKLSNEDELEEGGLANLVGPQRGDARRTTTGTTARTSGSKGGGSKRPAPQKGKDSKKGADGSASKRTTKKKKAKKTSPPDPPGEGKKKVVKCKKGQGDEPRSVTSKPPPEKKQKGERKKKKKKKAKGTPLSLPWEGAQCGTTAGARSATRSCLGGCGAEVKCGQAAGGPSAQCRPPGHSGPAKPDHVQFNSTPGPGYGRFLGWTQKIYSLGQSVTGVGGQSLF